MFLHIIDDARHLKAFIDRTNDLFPGNHRFYVIRRETRAPVLLDSGNILSFVPSTAKLDTIVEELPDYRAVFIHNLCDTKARIVNAAADEVFFIWGMWGFDYYYVFPELMNRIYLPRTRMVNFLLFKHFLLARKMSLILHPFLSCLGVGSHLKTRMKAAEKVDFTFTNLDDFCAYYHIRPVADHTRFRGLYYSLESISRGVKSSQSRLGNHIFIGNSASNSSNHLDVFYQIKKIPCDDRKIVVPLNYGSSRYRYFVKQAGRWMFGKNFISLTRFLPLEEYNEWLMKCNVMIFNHRRAQAVGNIIFGVFAGHRIFLREENPVFMLLQKMGVVVFSIERELSAGNLTGLPPDIQRTNWKIIQSHFGEEQIRRNYQNIIDAIP